MKRVWLAAIPFIVFLITYFSLIYIYRAEKIAVPHVTGKNILDLLDYDNHFSWKIYKVSYNKNYPHGYIVWQFPQGGILLKTNHSILLEVNHNVVQINQIKNMALQACIDKLSQEGFNYKLIPVKICGIKNRTVIGGMYNATDDLFYVYYSSLESISNKKYYMPNCIGMSCNSFMTDKTDLSHVICKDYLSQTIIKCIGEKISSQFPSPGILLKNDKKIYFWHEKTHCNEIEKSY